jgi:hypothetical protein
MLNDQNFGLIWDSAARSTTAAAAASEQCMCQAKLRILRCTALAFKREPGGLRFVPGSRSWLPVTDDDMAQASTQSLLAWAKP